MGQASWPAAGVHAGLTSKRRPRVPRETLAAARGFEGLMGVPGTPYDNTRKSIEALSPVDQLRLVAELISRLGGELTREPRILLELEGLGREVWDGTDVDEYLRRERWSWNG